MELEKAKLIANDLIYCLTPGVNRIIIAGSIRRQKPEVGDIELLVIPRANYLDKILDELMMQSILAMRLNKRGNRVYGPKNKLMVHLPSGIGVDIFSTTEECWPVALVVRTGGERTNKEIASRALERGMRFRAYGDGFDTPEGHIRCQTEADVFRAVGLRYLEPWERK
jgi:DNA polymerase (family 10)